MGYDRKLYESIDKQWENYVELDEIDFKTKADFDAYKEKHKMRDTTKVRVGGKDTTAGDASEDPNDDFNRGGESGGEDDDIGYSSEDRWDDLDQEEKDEIENTPWKELEKRERDMLKDAGLDPESKAQEKSATKSGSKMSDKEKQKFKPKYDHDSRIQSPEVKAALKMHWKKAAQYGWEDHIGTSDEDFKHIHPKVISQKVSNKKQWDTDSSFASESDFNKGVRRPEEDRRTTDERKMQFIRQGIHPFGGRMTDHGSGVYHYSNMYQADHPEEIKHYQDELKGLLKKDPDLIKHANKNNPDNYLQDLLDWKPGDKVQSTINHEPYPDYHARNEKAIGMKSMKAAEKGKPFTTLTRGGKEKYESISKR